MTSQPALDRYEPLAEQVRRLWDQTEVEDSPSRIYTEGPDYLRTAVDDE